MSGKFDFIIFVVFPVFALAGPLNKEVADDDNDDGAHSLVQYNNSTFVQ
jgi:hypothetical protein